MAVGVCVAVLVAVAVLVGVCGGHPLAEQTVTVKLHELEFPAPSTAVQVTVVVPIGNVLPDGGVQLKLKRPHASEAAAM